MYRLDSTGDTLNSTYSSDVFEESFGSSCEESEQLGFTTDIDIPDGRLSCPDIKRTILQVAPLEGASDHFTLRLVTNHHSFSLGRSVAIRTITSLYYLQNSLRDFHPYVKAPSLPPKFLFSFLSYQRQCEIFAKFLQEVLVKHEYLSNKAVHLFLQTNLTLEKIKLNIEGIRDDDVPNFPLVDKRNNKKVGFSEIFC